jgi:hypothetical protein
VVEDALAAHGLAMAPPAVELTTVTAVREAMRAGSPAGGVDGSRAPPAGPVRELLEIARRHPSVTAPPPA